MKLIDTDKLLQAAKLNGFAGESAAKFLMLLFRFRRINKTYSENSHKSGIAFIDAMIEQLGIRYEINREELEKIPREGAFITISNHPFGGIDGLLLIKLIAEIRPDYKVLPNFLLRSMAPVSGYTFNINPFVSQEDTGQVLAGLKEIFRHLDSGKTLGVFPAGGVSKFNQDMNAITDQQWQFSVLKMIKKANVPIVPVYFQGTNSLLFHILGRVLPKLQEVKLPSELFNKHKKVIKVRIGSPIPAREQQGFSDISRYGRFLRTKTYALGTSLEVRKFFSVSRRQLKRAEPVIDPVPVQKIEAELSRVIDTHSLFKIQNYNVICVPSVEIPNIMNEIGRLRELTFREVGEGTNQQMDIDEYDLYYYQLFIWDAEEHRIVGAYRVGKGKDILNIYGIKGFYIQSLFRMSRKLYPMLRQSLELGRSFVIPEYQKKPMPLFLLWKGILYFLLKNPEYRYLIGPVSISNRYSSFSRGLIIKFIKEYYYDHGLARHIRPRKAFIVPDYNIDTDILIEESNDLNRFERIFRDIETVQKNMPVLLKKYLKLNGRIVGFNIDPKFNNALDGLLILDLFDVPPGPIAALSKEVNDEEIMARFVAADLSHFGENP